MIKDLANKKKKKAFTLVEVIIVLAIIAIIAAIAIPNLTKVRQDSKLKADIQTAETIKRTIETLIVDETIKYGTGATVAAPNKIEVTFTGTVATTVTGLVGIKVPTSSGVDTDVAATVATVIDPYLTNVKKPQTDGKTKYVFTIDKAGTVAPVLATSIL